MRRAGRGQEGRTVLGQGPAGGWVQARHEGAICAPNGSRQKPEPRPRPVLSGSLCLLSRWGLLGFQASRWSGYHSTA